MDKNPKVKNSLISFSDNETFSFNSLIKTSGSEEKNKVSEEIIENYKKDWDSSAISPGTDFMNRLTLALKIHFKKTQKFKSIKVKY